LLQIEEFFALSCMGKLNKVSQKYPSGDILMVKGVYQREDDPSGNWYARFRIDGKLVKKSFGKDRTAAIEYVEKARTLRRTGEGHVPKSAKGTPKTAHEMEATAGMSSVLLSELCDDLLRHIQSKPNVYNDQRNPPFRIGLIREKFGDRPAAAKQRDLF
jgi:hypothetical protein